ncbi:glycosyltransferase [Streptosporangium sp. NPDC048047]|uniref:glycosyltransferase family 2 protein n=1 Tax=Streptosporangium sp. NPDC048047 TaxID=3155748 RepID=UPI003428B866
MPVQPSPSQAVPEPSAPDPAETGPAEADSAETGPGETGPGETGPEETGSAESGPATPEGFKRAADGPVAELVWDGRHWTADGEPLGERPSAAEVARLRPLRGLAVRWPAEPAPAGAVAGLAAAGVPLHAAVSPGWVEPGLARLLAAWTPEDDPGGPRSVTALRREEHSVRLRRHVLRGTASGTAGAAANRAANGAGTAAVTTPKVSVVMSSMRPHHLGQALAQIARQRGVEVEVLLALHGVPAGHEAVRRALAACEVPVTVVEAAADVPFGTALNTAALLAGGDYVAKWDDDDWYGPEHLADLLMARSYSGADIVGTAAEFFYLEPLDATVRRTDYTGEIWSDHVAGGTILLARDRFIETGGFPALPSGVDAAFLKAAHAAGARVYRTHGLGYVLRRSVRAQHTWRLPLAHFLRVASGQWRGFRPSLLLEAS